MLTLLAKLLQALNSESSTRQIALAISLAVIFGFSPLMSLISFTLLLIVLLVKVNLAAFIVAFAGFKILGVILSSLINSVGYSVLTSSALNSLLTGLYQFDLFKLAHLHNTYNMGAFVIGCLLAIPVYFLSQYLVEKYRENFKTFIEQLRLVKALKASKFFGIYQQLSGSGV